MPDNAITRAEVVTLVNRVLERAVDVEGMLDDMVTWSDNLPSDWYYEATRKRQTLTIMNVRRQKNSKNGRRSKSLATGLNSKVRQRSEDI